MGILLDIVGYNNYECGECYGTGKITEINRGG